MGDDTERPETPGYYAIVPASVRYDGTLPPAAKLLYGEITALTNAYGFCYASNRYFKDLYQVEERTVRRWIEALADGGYIVAGIEEGERRIRLVESIPQTLRADKNVRGGRTKMSGGADKNVRHLNNTLNNTSEYTTTGVRAWNPPSLEEVKAHGTQVGIAPALCENFWNHWQSVEWEDKPGIYLKGWPYRLRNWSVRERSEKAATKERPTPAVRADKPGKDWSKKRGF
jgi:hypothetical protein